MNLRRITFIGAIILVLPQVSFGASPLVFAESTTVENAFEGMLRDEALRVKVVQKAEPAVASVVISKDLGKIEKLKNDGTLDDSTKVTGGGTAFFVSADGLMFTNSHVVSDADSQYTVLLNSGKQLAARVVFSDPKTDVALLKVEVQRSPYLRLSSRTTLVLAQTVIAIGNSLGQFRNTVSVGIISGLQRTITATTRTGDFVEKLRNTIQTDAAINEGSSGGPLLNSRGDVIGMNTAFVAGSQNIGFAIPVSHLKDAMAAYRKQGIGRQ